VIVSLDKHVEPQEHSDAAEQETERLASFAETETEQVVAPTVARTPTFELTGAPPDLRHAMRDAANQVGRVRLIDQFIHRRSGDGVLPDLNGLWPILLGTSLGSAARESLALRVLRTLRSLIIELDIDSVQSPPGWMKDHECVVTFTVRNGTYAPTSGFVRGGAVQGGKELLAASWWQPAAQVSMLQPGDAFHGELRLNQWAPGVYAAPGSADISLQYWGVDPTGTLSVIHRLPDGQQATVTYSALGFSGVETVAVAFKSFATDIRPLFRDLDIQAMRGADVHLDLASYEQVKQVALQIYQSLTYLSPVSRMPCDGKWPAAWIARFKDWMDNGMLP